MPNSFCVLIHCLLRELPLEKWLITFTTWMFAWIGKVSTVYLKGLVVHLSVTCEQALFACVQANLRRLERVFS